MPGFSLELGRHVGLTHVIDKGLGPRAWEDILDVAGDHISIVKLGWGTAYVTRNLERKLEVLRDKPVVIGGTFFEVVYLRGKIDEYKQWLAELGLTHVEISDGTIEIPRERKLELIAEFARDFTVLSEVGSKDSSVEYTVDEWTRWLERGSRGRRLEGDHRGARGWYCRHLRLVGRHAHRADRRDRRRLSAPRTSSSRRRPRPRRPGSSSSSGRRSTSATSRPTR